MAKLQDYSKHDMSFVHSTDWKQSISHQLQQRKMIEQAPFEDIYSFASSMFESVDIYKSENIQINLQKEQLQQQLLGIQQTLLAGGSAAAKTILSKLNLPGSGDDAGSLSLGKATILAEKCQLEKKICDLQEKLTDALKSKSDAIQRVVDLKTELEEKDILNVKLRITLDEREKEVTKLREDVNKLERALKCLNDEHTALQLGYKSYEKRFHNLSIECDALTNQLKAKKLEDAERLNAENERIMHLQQERLKREIEGNVANMTRAQIARQVAGEPNALAIAALSDNFDILDDDDGLIDLRSIARIPSAVDFSFDAHDNEACVVNWYCCSGLSNDYLATGGSDRKVKLWKILDSSNTLVATLLGSNASITSIDVEGDAILASSNDFATRIWSINDYKARRTLTGHSAKVLSAKFLGKANEVASGSQDRTIKIWDVNQGACTRTYFAGSYCYDLIYNSYQVITGHFDAKIRCWDLKKRNDNEATGQFVMQSKITSLDVSNDGTKLLCSLRDNTIKCLDLRRMEVIQTYSDEKFRIGTESCRAKFSIDGQYITCGSIDGSLYIWDTNTAKVEKILAGHGATILASCWSPDGKRMVSVGKKVYVWT